MLNLPSLSKLKDILQQPNSLDSDMIAFKSSKQLLDIYLSYRSTGMSLLTELLKYKPKEAIQACGKKLGILKNKTLLFNTEGDMSVLFNYCLFHHYVGDKNAIDRYVTVNKDTLSGDKKTVALAMQQAKFAILVIEKTMSHGGVLVTDMLRGQKELLIDQGFSHTAVPGTILASTILRYPQFITTTGAALPLNNLSNAFESLVSDYENQYNDFDSMPKVQQSKFIANLLRICFREEVSENIRYQDLL